MALNPTALHIPILTPEEAKLEIMKQPRRIYNLKVLFNYTFNIWSKKKDLMYLLFLCGFNMGNKNLMVLIF